MWVIPITIMALGAGRVTATIIIAATARKDISGHNFGRRSNINRDVNIS
jgi:hypothetical protein